MGEAQRENSEESELFDSEALKNGGLADLKMKI
ncbi:hypothetical protein AARI_03340 [Glutamicibacter arilaitensis Re117]|jgi:hypothetical protein|uniref:Uncharacterized protein n=1 Tax=Glutamicibacter arilaitensis (strain DSM 16368 / CIP 108037 / IAM 15318 / JCM 13566 / NCIMB 14258 / Re117) TaxID=861360 RepID=A0ABM9PTP7_GLUAR|nr:hypothetical protein AARI_03340 [Glutamicibacter arilaitensis Re117]